MSRLATAALMFTVPAAFLGCQSAADSPIAPSASEISRGGAASPADSGSATTLSASRVDICHRTGRANNFILITVAESAVAAHLAHGDGRVGESVPGQPSMLFGVDCTLLPVAPAGPISFSFSGHVTEIFNPNNILGVSPSLSDAIVGTYTFDSAAAPEFFSPTTTHYVSSPTPPFGVTVQIGPNNFEAFPGLLIGVSNDSPNFGDRYFLFSSSSGPAGSWWVQLELGTTSNLDVFDSTALPLVLPDISLFDTKNEFVLNFHSVTVRTPLEK
jgi:hypothetical protein